jgi:hypothetical protein
MEHMTQTLPSAEWINEQAAYEPDAAHAENVNAIKAYKETAKQNEAELADVLAALKMKPSDIEARERAEADKAQVQGDAAEAALAGQGPDDDLELARQVTLDTNLVPQTVTGTGPGNFYDFTPYSSWQRWYTHNEGGTTIGRVSNNRTGRRMHSYSHAVGDGSGISDDNYVTSWTKFYYALWPRRNGHVRAFVPYTTRGSYNIYANDKWYNSKEAKIDVDFSVRLSQNYWGGHVTDHTFSRSSQNINQSGRVDLNRSVYSGSLPVGAGKWVIAEVAVKNHVYTSGGGSRATMNFEAPDGISVPYVRFDFS